MNKVSAPLISVVIPAYNHERYIGDCIRSVVAQDWSRMELLVVDDGSTDGTWRMMQTLAEEARRTGRFERVEIATQKNQGICATLNRLCEMAQGEAVAVIASDDMYLPGALSSLMTVMMEDAAVGLVVGQNELMDGEGLRCYWDCDRNVCYDGEVARFETFNQFLFEKTGVADSSESFGAYESLVRENHVPNGMLYRKSILARVLPYVEDGVLEDWWMNLQLAKITKFRAIAAHTFRYRWHATNTIKQSKKMEMAAKRTLRWEYDYVARLGQPRWIEAIRRATYSDRVLFSLFGLIEVHRIRDLDSCCRVLQIARWRFVFRVRRVLPCSILRPRFCHA